MKFLNEILDSVTNKLIFLNVIVFVIIWILSLIFKENLIPFVALQPISIMSGKYLWTIITSMFTHFTFWHLLANMISFYFVGNFVEKIIGGRRVLFVYFLSGIFGSLFWVLTSFFFGNSLSLIFGNPVTYGIGASGAVFGFIGVLALLTPKTKIYMIVGPIVAIIIEYILYSILPSTSVLLNLVDVLISVYCFAAIISMFDFTGRFRIIGLPAELQMWLLPIVAIVPLVLIGLFVELPIGNMVHFGGLIFGLLFAFVLKKKYPKKTKMIAKRFMN